MTWRSPGAADAGPPAGAETRLAHALRAAGLEVWLEQLPVPAGPAVPGLARALLRAAAGGLIVAGARRTGPLPQLVGSVCALVAALAQLADLATRDPLAGVLARLPGLGRRARCVVARARPAGSRGEPPLIVVVPLGHWPAPQPAWGGAAVLLSLAAAGVSPSAGASLALGLGAALGLEGIAAAVREVRAGSPPPAQGRPGGGAPEAGETVLRIASFAARRAPARELWLLASGAGPLALARFLRRHPRLARDGWVVVLDPPTGDEAVIVSGAWALRRRQARAAVVRAFAGAAIDTGEPASVERLAPGTAVQAAALARGVPAVTLRAETPQRAARIAYRVAAVEL